MKLRRVLLGSGLLLAVAGAIGGWYVWKLYTGIPERVRSMVIERFEQHYPRLDFTVARAHFDPEGEIDLYGISVCDAGAGGEEIVNLPEVRLEFDPAALGSGALDIRAVHVYRPLLRAVRREDGWNVARFLPLPPQLSRTRPAVRIEGARIEIQDAAAGRTLQLRGLDLTLSHEPESDRFVFDVSFTSEHARQVTCAGFFESESGHWSFVGQADRVQLGPQLWRALPVALPEEARFLDYLTALASVHFEASQAAGEAQPRYGVVAELSEGRLSDPRLPLPCRDLEARLHVADGRLVLERLVAHNGTTLIEASGELLGLTANSPAHLNVRVARLMLDDRVRAALPADWQAAWDRINPRGLVDLDAHLEFDGASWTPTATLTCRDGAFVHQTFPYPVEHVTGLVEQRGNVVTYDLVGEGGGRRVALRGEVINPGLEAQVTSEVHADHIAIDERLTAAMHPALRATVEELALRGTADVFCRFFRPAGPDQEYERYIWARLRDCSTLYRRFPYPVSGWTGIVEYLNGQWQFREFVGHNGYAVVTAEGTFGPTADGNALDLRVEGRDVVLDEQVRAALPPSAQQFWSDFSPQGTTDIGAQVAWLAGGEPDVRLAVELADGRLFPRAFPYAMHEVQATASFHRGQIVLHRFAAQHGDVALRLVGEGFRREEDGAWELRLADITADQLHYDRDLRQALPEGLRDVLDRMNPRGTMALQGALNLRGSGGPQSVVTAGWNFEVVLNDAELEFGLDAGHVHGTFNLTGTYDGNAVDARGRLALDSLNVLGYQVTELQAPLLVRGDEIRIGDPLAFEPEPPPARMGGRAPSPLVGEGWGGGPDAAAQHLTARFLGGTLWGDARITSGPEPAYQVRLALWDADLRRYAVEYLPGRRRLAGRMDAELELSGDGLERHDLNGRGILRVSQGDLYELPVVLAILKILSLDTPDTTAFTEADLDYRLVQGRLVFDRVDLYGNPVSLRGQGQMTLDGQIFLELYTAVGDERMTLPLITSLLGEASRQLMLVRVTGTTREPETQVEAVPLVGDLLEMFGPLPRPRGAMPR